MKKRNEQLIYFIYFLTKYKEICHKRTKKNFFVFLDIFYIIICHLIKYFLFVT
ncbi:uncharacterized protein BX663DRAFT_521981 [Cokeromyces recurvatus]|uniref:uncharacterized protein n=1 Tax=Cokeromyces recurvatus TaxID=90255 RepID=UPI0022208F98|nr:uncharacterized protein BX663DRAFT_521981 [Cokeromyces recurvatus]KAI7899258.1 hypothetical protein BX663DRAFT_521981 [Cokeromyces recurvatus]